MAVSAPNTTDDEPETDLATDVQYPNSETGNSDGKDSVDKYDYLDKAREDVKNADLIVLSDGDADGIASAALVDYVFAGMEVAMIPVGPHRSAVYPSKGMELIAEHGREDMTVFFLDTCLNDEEDWMVESLEDMGEQARVHFFDHHEWTNEDRIEYVRENTHYCELDTLMETPWEVGGETIEERCTAKMVYDYFVDNGIEFPDEISDRIEAVTVGDLWLKNDNYEFKHDDTQFVMDSLEYVTDIHMSERYDDPWFGYGTWAEAFCDTSTPLAETVLADYAEDYRTRIDNRLDVVFNNDGFVEQYEVDGIEVAFVYGDVPPNDPATELRRQGMDVVVIMFPWMKCSLRGTENFDNCHLLAEDLGGGGHGMASGATLRDINPYDSKKDYYEDYGREFHDLLLEMISEYAEK